MGNTFRTKEKPFEWRPELAMPISTSPSSIVSPVIRSRYSATPTAKPARSNSSSG